MYVSQFPASLLIRRCSFWMRKNRSGTHRAATEASGISFSTSFENPGYLCLYTTVSGNQKQLYPDEPLIQAATFMMLDEDNITRQTVGRDPKRVCSPVCGSCRRSMSISRRTSCARRSPKWDGACESCSLCGLPSIFSPMWSGT